MCTIFKSQPALSSVRSLSSKGSCSFKLTSFRSFMISSTSSASKTIKDPIHPTGIYYHSLPNSSNSSASSSTSPSSSTSSSWAISLLPTPPSSSSSASILAHLQLTTSTTSKDEQDDQIPSLVRSNPDNVKPNKEFMRTLHRIFREEIVEKDDMLKFEAGMRGSGWAHLSDPRHELMPGRIPTPDSIFATVAFSNSEIQISKSEEVSENGSVPGYEVNDTYRLITKEEGPIQLRDEWLEVVRRRLEEVN